MTLDQVCRNGEALRGLAKGNVSLHDWEVERMCLQAFGSSGVTLELWLLPPGIVARTHRDVIQICFESVEIEDWGTFLHQNVLFDVTVARIRTGNATSRYRARLLSSMGWYATFTFVSARCSLERLDSIEGIEWREGL
ncbi:MAG: hypothetical protein D6724_11070 [Armatimonadetes bacterium]|nr:MAG: hypothetical protein D6724_11070 [Armatimonadota bacterium]